MNEEIKMTPAVKLEHLIRSGYTAIAIRTVEQDRVRGIMVDVMQKIKVNGYEFLWFEPLAGVCSPMGGTVPAKLADATQCAEMLDYILSDKENSGVYVINDMQLSLGGMDNTPFDWDNVTILKGVIRHIRTLVGQGISKHLILVGARFNWPAELEKEIHEEKIGLPDTAELTEVIKNVAVSGNLELKEEEMQPVVDALRGQTTNQAADSLSFSFLKHKKFIPAEIAYEKAAQFEKTGLLKLMFPKLTLDDIAGYDLWKQWIKSRDRHLSQIARDMGLRHLKGALVGGPPGTGKTVGAQALASHWKMPLAFVDWGSLFGKYVGESEERLRNVIEIAEALAPVILVIDEVEKGLGSSGSGGDTEGGETSRKMLATFLTWMSEKTKPVFPYCTANDLSMLANVSDGALVRKGRFDVIVFTDLPNLEERKAIWRLKLKQLLHDARAEQYRISPPNWNWEELEIYPDMLAEDTENWTGAEIEQAIIDAGWIALAEEKSVDTCLLGRAIKSIRPVYEMQRAKIDASRKWAQANCLMASAPLEEQQAESKTGQRKFIA